MRIRVDGDSESAVALRSLLKKAGYALGNVGLPGTLYTVKVEHGTSDYPVVDGVDCELERRIVNCIAELSPSGRVLLQRKDGIQSQYAIRIVVPDSDGERQAVELGVLRGLSQVVPPGTPAPRPKVSKAVSRAVTGLLMILGLR